MEIKSMYVCMYGVCGVHGFGKPIAYIGLSPPYMPYTLSQRRNVIRVQKWTCYKHMVCMYDAYRLTPCHMSVFLNEGFQGLLVARIVLTRTNLGQLVFLLSCKSFYWYTYKKDSHLKFYLLVATRAWRSMSLPCSQLNSKRLWGLLECKILPIVEKMCTVIAAKCVWCVSKDEYGQVWKCICEKRDECDKTLATLRDLLFCRGHQHHELFKMWSADRKRKRQTVKRDWLWRWRRRTGQRHLKPKYKCWLE